MPGRLSTSRTLARLLLAGACAYSTSARADERLTHHRPAFLILIPTGFVEKTNEERSNRVLAYERPPSTPGKVPSRLYVDRLRRELARGAKMSAAERKEVDAHAGVVTSKWWRGGNVEIVTTHEGTSVSYVARVPVRPEALELTMTFDQSEPKEGRVLFEDVLANIDREPDPAFTSTSDEPQRMSTGARLGRGLVGFFKLAIFVAVIVSLARYLRRSKSAPAAPIPASASGVPKTSSKCPACGLVNMPEPVCRRCGAPL